MNLSGLGSLLKTANFTLGAEIASVAAGPVGRTAAAETDAWMFRQNFNLLAIARLVEA